MFKLYRIPLKDGKKVPMPIYATPGSAAMDFYSANTESVVINPGKIALVSLGIKIALKPGYKLTLKPRSGIALKNGITIPNSPTTIDSDYRGVVHVILHNTGDKKFFVEPFMRICQGEIEVAPQRKFAEIFNEEELGDTIRGEGGFGHTGLSA